MDQGSSVQNLIMMFLTIFILNKELYLKQLITQSCDAGADPIQTTDKHENVEMNNWKKDGKIHQGIIPAWSEMRKLQESTNSWCFLNFFFFLSVVGRCM